MEKRLFLFFVLSALILGGQFFINAKFGPKRPPKKDNAAEVAGKDAEQDGGKSGDDAGETDKAPDAKPGTEKSGDKPTDKPGEKNGEKPGEKGAENDPSGKSADGKDATNEKEPPKPAVPPQWVTLGSLDPASGYRMLVTLNNRGAAVERIELSSPRYHDLETPQGYLGHLALTPDPDGKGSRVHAVGPGTPAALATADDGKSPSGIKVGDLILEINGEETPSGLIVDDLLKKSRPGEKLKIQLQRDGQQLDYSVTLRAHPLEIVRPDRQTEHESVEGHPLSCLVGLETVGIGTKATNVKRDADEIGALPSLREGHWELVSSNADMAEFRFVVGEKQLKAIGQTGELEVIKRYQLAKATTEQIEQVTAPAYHVNIELEIRSRGVPNRTVAYRMSGPNGLPLEGWWYMSKTGARDVVIRTDAGGMQWKRCPEIYKKAIKRPTEAEPNVEPWVTMFAGDTPVSGRAIRYIGVDAQYFSAVLFPIGSDGGAGVFRQARAVGIGDARRIPSARNKTLNVSFELSSEPTLITEEAPLKHTYKLFAGPKQADLLDQYGATGAGGKGSYSIRELNDFGWFGFVAQPMSRLLHGFFYLTGNYGVAIVMLTLLVRSCMLPISYKATKSAQRMQELSPEMKKLAEKYKDAPDKRMKAQQELFRKHNVNPFGSCLLALCQLPIFIGLYRCLSIDIELRQAPLVAAWQWCSNLAGPDMLWYWKAFMPGFLADETGYLGPYFNFLPLVTVGLFVVNQQLMTPPATDEQTRLQQKMMKFMTIFIGVMFFKVASGLCVYFIASSLWSLAEHKVLRKGRKPGDAASGTTAASR